MNAPFPLKPIVEAIRKLFPAKVEEPIKTQVKPARKTRKK
jgi:hypothetical protein